MDDALAEALREENQRLRAAVAGLTEQLAAARAAQSDQEASLPLIAALRRVQERLRLAAQNRQNRARAAGHGRATRRRSSAPGNEPHARAGTGPSVRGAGRASPEATIEALRALPPATIGRHPLLLRTLAHPSGNESAPRQEPTRAGCAGRVMVVVHVYYSELWPMLADRIERIPAPVDLVVTLAEGAAEASGEEVVARFPQATLVHVPNRGRDMAPFLRVLDLGLVGDHDAVLKLHTKRSVHRSDGDAWRDRLLGSLCGDAQRIELILRLLRSDSDVGMVAAAGSALGHRFWGANGPLVDALGVRAGFTVDPRHVRFPGGSMFWSRPGPLNELRRAHVSLDDFEHEILAIDGTTAHALERFVGVSVAHHGMRVIAADEVAGELAAGELAQGRRVPRW